MTTTPGREPTPTPGTLRPARVCFAQTLALLLLGLAPLPLGWARARSALDSARSTELNRADREAAAGGYYQGLIGGPDGPGDGRAGDIAMRLVGKPTDWARFHAANVCNPLPDRDFLQFELKPGLARTLFGHPFRTNRHGMRDRDYPVEKPDGVVRVAVLGSSMDMGWGIAAEDTYVKRLEGWLNARAARRADPRRFEVMNFAVAAYAPLQRMEAYRRKVRGFAPDLVIYSATMLDNRLAEIHLCDLLRARSDLGYDFVRDEFATAGLTGDDVAVDAANRLVSKELVKRKLRPRYWALYDATLGALAADCRSDGVPLACVIIPRVGRADAPEARAESVARLRGIAAHHAVPLFDLSGTFDGQDPALFEIASWDDHPNALGHHRLFVALAHTLVAHPEVDRTLFPGPAPGMEGGRAAEAGSSTPGRPRPSARGVEHPSPATRSPDPSPHRQPL